MPRATRKTRTPMSGRAKVALTLVSLLSIAAIVVWRRSTAVAENRVVRTLETRKRELISLRTTLERDMNEAMSRARIVPAAERRLGMHVATELEVRYLPTNSSRDSIVADTAEADTSSLSRVASRANAGSSAVNGARPR
jgi:type II secretory pathway component PulJ